MKYEIIIALLFVALHLPDLGHDTFNTDVWKWKARSYDFGTGVFTFQPEKTLQKYHPGVTLTWLGAIGVKITNLVTDAKPTLSELDRLFLLHFIQKLLVVLTTGVSVSFAFYALKKILGLVPVLLSIALLILEPYYIGLSREFHLEGLLSTFMLVSILWLYYFLDNKKQKKRLYISAIFAGLSLLTKTSAVFLVLFAGLVLLLQTIRSKELNREVFWYFKWVFISIAICFIFWPALWIMPGTVFTELVRGVKEVGVDTEHIQFYFGKLVQDPGPFYYLVVLGLRSSVYLLVGFLGLAFIFKKLEAKHKKFVLFLLMYVFFYFLQLSIPSKKLDRYVLPTLVALSICAGVFWNYFLENTVKNKKLHKYIAFLIPLILTNIFLHPDYLSYYSPLFGGLKTGLYVLEPKWMIGQKEVIKYFTELAAKNNFTPSGQDQSFEEVVYRAGGENVLSVGFQEKYYTQIWPFFREMNAWAVVQDLSPFAVKTKYFVYPVWDDRAKEENRFKLKYLDEIKVRGVPVYRVYERIV